MSDAQRGKPHSAEHRRKIGEALRSSPKCAAQLARLHKNYASQLELFIKELFLAHNYHFIHQGHIPGFCELAGRHHAFDFLLPDKRLAIEMDGAYWHSAKNPNGWDVVREAEDVLWASLLCWRVVRIPERVLRTSKSFKAWKVRIRREAH